MSLQSLSNLKFLGRRKNLVGIDIGSYSVKIVSLRKNGDQWALQQWAMIPYNDETGADIPLSDRKDQIITLLQTYLKTPGLAAKRVATSVSGNSVIVRYVKMAKMSRADLSKSLKFEAEPYIPFNIEDVSLGFQVIGDVVEDGQVQMDTVIVAAKKESIDTRIDILRGAGLQPAILDVDAFAIENAFESTNPMTSTETVMFINIGSSFTNMSIVEKGVSRVVRDVSIAGSTFTKAIQNQLQCDFKVAEQKKMSVGLDPASEDTDAAVVVEVLTAVTRDLITEIQRSMDFYISQGSDRSIARLYLCGGGAGLKGLESAISSDLHMEVSLFDPISLLQNAPLDLTEEQKKAMPQLAVAVGLATREEGDSNK
jgi:type IV pilus assembly protein PilM